MLLAFPKIETEAITHLKYKLTITRPPLDDFYAETFWFGDNEFVDTKKINIKSKIPLHILVNDPEKYLKITEKKDKDLHQIEITLKKPVYKQVINEPGSAILNYKNIPWVSVSSINDWKEFAKKQGERTAKIIAQALPKDFEAILKEAKKKTNEVDQINTVTSLLNDKVRYMGDWRTIKGRFVPRDLATISKTQIGDCKDFSAATAAILNKLGFKAQAVVVMRGIKQPSLDILPGFEAANHQMLKVTGKDNKVYWIDPTNFVSMADGIFPDIAGKMALILDPKQPGYEKIPEVDYSHAKADLKREWDIIENDIIIEKGRLVLENEETLGLIGSELKISSDVVKDIIFDYLAGTTLDKKEKKSMELPKLDSRIADKIALTYTLEKNGDILSTNAGFAFNLSYIGGIISKICDISQDYVADIVVDAFPCTITKETIIKNIKVKNIGLLNKEIKTPWLYVKRSCKLNKDNNLQINDAVILYKNIIPAKDFENPEFIRLKKWLKRNFKNTVILFESEKLKSNIITQNKEEL